MESVKYLQICRLAMIVSENRFYERFKDKTVPDFGNKLEPEIGLSACILDVVRKDVSKETLKSISVDQRKQLKQEMKAFRRATQEGVIEKRFYREAIRYFREVMEAVDDINTGNVRDFRLLILCHPVLPEIGLSTYQDFYFKTMGLEAGVLAYMGESK